MDGTIIYKSSSGEEVELVRALIERAVQQLTEQRTQQFMVDFGNKYNARLADVEARLARLEREQGDILLHTMVIG